MSLLVVEGLTKYYGPTFIFGGISFRVARGDKIGLVGVNGAGKSTLLKAVAGIEAPTRGAVHLARGVRVAYLAQETRIPQSGTLAEAMLAAAPELAAMRAELAELEHSLGDTAHPAWQQRMERYGELAERFAHAGGYELDQRIDRTLTGLGFSAAQHQQPVHELSGGQQTRAALAAALVAEPDLLLLDEPTNHLDLEAVAWLESFLAGWAGTLVVISHDRYLLNKVTGRTIELAFGRLDGDYPAGYEGYLALKAARDERQLKEHQIQSRHIAETEEFIRRYKNGSRRSQAVGRERRLKKLKEGYLGSGGIFYAPLVEAPQQQRQLSIGLDARGRSGELVLRLTRLAAGYGGRPVVRCPEVELRRGERVAVIGPNGGGKTTLLRTLIGELAPVAGQVQLGHGVQPCYVKQTPERPADGITLLETVRAAAQGLGDQEARALLGRFLFSGDDVDKPVAGLSGGERSRLELARLSLAQGNLLVLDEPTNHLDIGAREALEEALAAYPGTLLIVSHDRAFIDAVADTLWVVRDGALTVFDGSYAAFAASAARVAQRRRAS